LLAPFSLLAKFIAKRRNLYLKIQKLCDFGGSQSAKVREKIHVNHQISIFGFQCAAKNI
jgi:hypothetical protein